MFVSWCAAIAKTICESLGSEQESGSLDACWRAERKRSQDASFFCAWCAPRLECVHGLSLGIRHSFTRFAAPDWLWMGALCRFG